MKVKEIEVGMTLNLGDNESQKLSMLLELEEHDSVTEIYETGQKLLAQLISNGNPEIYEKCMKKLNYKLSSDEYRKIMIEWEAKEQVDKIKKVLDDNGY